MSHAILSAPCRTVAIAAGVLALAFGSAGCGKSASGTPTGPTKLVPIVNSVTPNSGPSGSAITIRISGSGFEGGATVTLGGEATAVTFINSTLLTARTGIHTAGPVDVVVTNPGGVAGSLHNGFTYVPLAITGVSPRAALGENPISVSGTGFVSGA